jgi:hypothetical protein
MRTAIVMSGHKLVSNLIFQRKKIRRVYGSSARWQSKL